MNWGVSSVVMTFKHFILSTICAGRLELPKRIKTSLIVTPTLVVLDEGCGLAGNSATRIFDAIHVVDYSCISSYPVGKCHCMRVNRDDWLAFRASWTFCCLPLSLSK